MFYLIGVFPYGIPPQHVIGDYLDWMLRGHQDL